MPNLYPPNKRKPFKPVGNADKIAKSLLDFIPVTWSLVPVNEKIPYHTDWQVRPNIPFVDIAEWITDGEKRVSKNGKKYRHYPSGVGLRTGEASGGLIDIDVDGNSAQPILEAISKGNLPTTVSWSSGKPGRYHLLYKIPDKYREVLKDFDRIPLKEFQGLKTVKDESSGKDELLEFRGNGYQCVLPPSLHSGTRVYEWINSPESVEVAELPEEICNYLVNYAEKQLITAQLELAAKKDKQQTDREATLIIEKKDYGSSNYLVSFLNNEVYPKLDLIQAFPGFELMNQSGHDLWGSPQYRVSKSGTSFSITEKDGYPAYYDFKEGHGGDCIQYRYILKGGKGYPTRKDYFDIVKELTAEVGLELPKNESQGFTKPEKAETVNPNAETVETVETKPKAQLTDYELKVAREQKRLNTLTIKPEWEVLKSEGRFLDEKLLEKIPYSGMALLPVPIGAGKSTFVNKILKKYPDRKVISLTPTITLGRGQAISWDLTWREDAEAQGVANGLMLSNTQKLGLCYPSLHKLSGTVGEGDESERFSNIDNKKLILILDEAEEGLNFLMQSSMTNQQGKRPYNIAALKDLLKDAKKQEILVIVADANLKNPAVDYLTKILPDLPVTLITSDYKPERGTATYYDQPLSVFEHTLKEAVEDDKRVIIPCDSQEHGEALDKRFTAMGYKVVRCDKTTAAGDDMKAFIANPDKFIADVQPQIVVYSPTLGSGTSIQTSQEYADNFQKIKQLQPEEISLEVTENLQKISDNWEKLTPYFDLRFAYNYHLSPPLFRQKIGRYRYPIPTSYWCGKDLPITGCKSPLPSEQLRQAIAHNEGVIDVLEMARKEAGTDDSLDILKAMTKIMTEAYKGKNPELTLWAEQRARECFFQVNRAEKLIQELEDDGYAVKRISEELEEGEELEDSEFGEEVKKIKEETRKELSLAVVNAPIIPEEDFNFLEKKPSLSPEERVYVDRYRFEQKLPGLLDYLSDNGDKNDKAAKFYYCAKLKDKLHWVDALRLFWGYSKQDDLRDGDLISFDFAVQRFEKSGVATLQDNRSIKTGFFKFTKECGLLDAKDGVDLNDLDKEYTAESFKKLLHSFRGKHKAKLKTYFDAIPLKDDSRAVPWINKRLMKFALGLSLYRKDSDGERYYKLTPIIPNWGDENIKNKIFEILDAKIASNVDTANTSATAVTSRDCIQPTVVTAVDFERTTDTEKTNLVVHLDDPMATVFDQAEILMATCSAMLQGIAKEIYKTGSVAVEAFQGLDVIQLLAIDQIVAELSGA